MPPYRDRRPRLAVLALLAILALHRAAAARPQARAGEASWRFTDVTALAGVEYLHGYRDPLESADGSFDERRHFAAGVASGDYDGDGWIDLYAVRGDIGPNLLFRNRGDGSFAEVGGPAGVAVEGAAGAGPAFADIDGDGRLDLFVGGVHGTPPRLFRNRGDGRFDDVTASSGLGGDRPTFSAAFGDYDRDGDLDLALAHWASFVDKDESSQTLWRNDGGLRFTDVSSAAGITAALRDNAQFAWDFTFTPNFADIDNDGWADLLLAADFGSSRVLLNRRDGTFADVTDRAVITDENGMGAAVGDYDNDGLLDWFVSSVWDPAGTTIEHWGTSGNRLYRGRGDGRFEDVTDRAGVRVGYWGWAATWGDFDNDGFLDLVHVNGFGRSAEYMPTKAFFADPIRLFVADGDGTFRERAAELGLVDTSMGRGVVAFDYDRDGDLDLLLAGSGVAARLFRNDDGNGGQWLDVKLRAPGRNSEAIGARIYVTAAGITQMRELHAGSNFESQDPAEAHFGLGAAAAAEVVRVVWPDGQATELEDVAAGRRLVLEPLPPPVPTPTPTMPPSVAPTPVPTQSPTGTPTVEQTAPPTPVPSSTPPAACAGDCNRDGTVTVDELVSGIAIALGTVSPARCVAMDLDRNDAVTIDEIVRALNAALRGCAAALPEA